MNLVSGAPLTQFTHRPSKKSVYGLLSPHTEVRLWMWLGGLSKLKRPKPVEFA